MGAGPQTVTLAFRDRAREAAFMDDFARETQTFYRLGLVAVLLFWSASVGFDLAAPVEAQPRLMLVRFAAVAPVMLIATVVGFLPWRWYRRWCQPSAIAVYLAVQLGIAAMVVIAPGQLSLLVIGGYLVTVLIGAAVDLARAVYIIGSGLVGAGVMMVAMARSPAVDGRALGIEALWIAVALLAGAMVSVRFEQARRRRFLDREALAAEQDRTEQLLANLLPAPIAARLRDGPTVIADAMPAVTVVFADLVGFTPLAARLDPHELVARLDRVFSRFDAIAAQHGVEKIKTIGDAYMVVAGAPYPRADHAIVAARVGLEMVAALAELEPDLQLRVGLASGPVVAGVIGRSKSSYDLWGETVNLASRMESHGVPGRVQVAPASVALLEPAFTLEPRGTIEVKGVGPLAPALVVARR